MVNASIRVAVALGSNLGDRRGHLEFGVTQLAALLTDLRVSTIRETAPVDVSGPQPPYLNAVAAGACDVDPQELLQRLLAIENARGRNRPSLRAPRTLDLDLILYGDRVIDRPGLTVPHPRFRERGFVLEPLAEIAPEWEDPITGKTVVLLRDELAQRNDERPSGPNGECFSDP